MPIVLFHKVPLVIKSIIGNFSPHCPLVGHLNHHYLLLRRRRPLLIHRPVRLNESHRQQLPLHQRRHILRTIVRRCQLGQLLLIHIHHLITRLIHISLHHHYHPLITITWIIIIIPIRGIPLNKRDPVAFLPIGHLSNHLFHLHHTVNRSSLGALIVYHALLFLDVDRKPPPPPPSHPYNHPAPPPPPAQPSSVSSTSVNRASYGAPPPRNSHYNTVPPPNNPYPPPQAPFGTHPHHAHPPSLMNVGGEKRSYDPAHDPNNHKRPRPSSSSQQWNNK